MTTLRIAHLSDPHLPPPAMRLSLRDLFSKRTLSRLAWRRKRGRHPFAVLSALVADVKTHAPHHIALTGDLTNFSTPEELAAARQWLADIAPPDRLTVSPGNHDALVADPGGDRFAPWRPWLADEPGEIFPTVRVRGHVAIINLCSATPTALHLAQGRLGPEQIARLAESLAHLREAGLFRLVLVHHPIAAGAVSKRKSLVDAEALRGVLQREGAELVLHGHAHEALTMQVPGPEGPIPVLGVPSASAAPGHGEAARWHELAISGTEDGFVTEVTARGLVADGTFSELGRYRLASPRT